MMALSFAFRLSTQPEGACASSGMPFDAGSWRRSS